MAELKRVKGHADAKAGRGDGDTDGLVHERHGVVGYNVDEDGDVCRRAVGRQVACPVGFGRKDGVGVGVAELKSGRGLVVDSRAARQRSAELVADPNGVSARDVLVYASAGHTRVEKGGDVCAIGNLVRGEAPVGRSGQTDV